MLFSMQIDTFLEIKSHAPTISFNALLSHSLLSCTLETARCPQAFVHAHYDLDECHLP